MAGSSAAHGRTVATVMMAIWMRRGPVACLLWPLSLLFGLLAAIRRGLYRSGLFASQRLPVPVVVVGNLFVGGTGKTPFTIWLVEALRERGFRPGVISRGYGASVDTVQRVTTQSSAREMGDEPVLIALRTGCPLMVGRNRVGAGAALLSAHPEVDVIIADDGLQHYRMARDVEVVLSDARGEGNGWLLPAGPLREPTSRPRDFSVMNLGSAPEAGVPASAGAPPDGAFARAGHLPIPMRLLAPLAEQLADRTQRTTLGAIATAVPTQSIVAAAGIGNPARFFDTLRAAGLTFTPLPLPDHHAFTAQTFADCSADLILITEKDAVKCREIKALATDPRFWVVPVQAHIAAPLADYIVEKLRGHATA